MLSLIWHILDLKIENQPNGRWKLVTSRWIHLRKKLAQLQQGLTDIKNKLAQLNGDRNNRQSSLNNNIFVDLSPIKVAFSDFFSGWMTVMPALGKGVAQQEEAKNVYQTTFENLFNVTSIKESEEK